MPFALGELSNAPSGAGLATTFLRQQPEEAQKNKHPQHLQQIMPAVSSAQLINTTSNINIKSPCITSTISPTLTSISSALCLNITSNTVVVTTTTPSASISCSSALSAKTSSSSSSSCESDSSPLTSSLSNSLLSTPSSALLSSSAGAASSTAPLLLVSTTPSSSAIVTGITNSLTASLLGSVEFHLQQPKEKLPSLIEAKETSNSSVTVATSASSIAKSNFVATTPATDTICTSLLPTSTISIASSALSSPLASSTSASSSLTVSTMSAPSTSAQLLLNGLVAAGCVSNLNNQQQQQQQQQYQHQILADDPRALQLALDLSMVSLNEAADGMSGSNNNSSNSSLHLSNYQQQLQQQQLVMHNHQKQQHHHPASNAQVQQQVQSNQQQCHHQQFDLNTLNVLSAAVAAATNNSSNNSNVNAMNIGNSANSNGSNNTSHTLNQFPVPSALLPTIEDRSKKSQNMTECVPVPSSEHVAEIVGRQGCKIKALRAKTNTYIKTPVRNEEPVFVVTGRKEDVAKAKREILSAAEHFSLIRATRKPSIDGAVSVSGSTCTGSGGSSTGCGKTPPGPPSIAGQVTIQVRVPYRVVGLVVGPKGATIKHIQQETQTYIVTPSREKEPIFEVTGLPDNVQSARKQIEAHIALRTGNLPLNNSSGGNASMLPTLNDSLASVHNLNALSQILNDATDPDLLATLYKTDNIRSAFDYLENGSSVAAAAVAAVSGIVSPNSMNNGSINFNVGSSGGIDGNNIANQLLMGSLGNCNNFQLQNLNGTKPNNDYLSSLINTCNLNNGGGPGNGNLIADIGDIVLQRQQQTHHTPSINSHIQQQQHVQAPTVAPQVRGNFLGNTNSYNILNATTMNAINLSGIPNTATNSALLGTAGNMHTMVNGVPNNGHHSGSGSTGMTRSCSSASSTTSSKSANNSGSGSSSNNSSSSRPELMNIWKNLGDSLDVDEGIGDSPSIWALPTPLTAFTGSHCSPSTSISPTDSLLGEISTANHQNHGLNHLLTSHETGCQKNLHLQQQTPQPSCEIVQQNINMPCIRRECLVCSDKEVTAVLVPCGHNMFCMECANRICSSSDATCPVCSLTVYHAMRILA